MNIRVIHTAMFAAMWRSEGQVFDRFALPLQAITYIERKRER